MTPIRDFKPNCPPTCGLALNPIFPEPSRPRGWRSQEKVDGEASSGIDSDSDSDSDSDPDFD